MTRGKPNLLSRKPTDRKRAEAKAEAEEAFRSGSLPKAPPAELKGMPAAQRAWRKLMKAHAQLPGALFNGLDRGFLIGYCLAVAARQRALDLEVEIWKALHNGHASDQMDIPKTQDGGAINDDGNQIVDGGILSGNIELQDLLKVRAELRMSIRLVSDMEKQLYASPKSRGGISPETRELTPEEVIEREIGDLDKLLGGSRT
jgi:hypothetical protein